MKQPITLRSYLLTQTRELETSVDEPPDTLYRATTVAKGQQTIRPNVF